MPRFYRRVDCACIVLLPLLAMPPGQGLNLFKIPFLICKIRITNKRLAEMIKPCNMFQLSRKKMFQPTDLILSSPQISSYWRNPTRSLSLREPIDLDPVGHPLRAQSRVEKDGVCLEDKWVTSVYPLVRIPSPSNVRALTVLLWTQE